MLELETNRVQPCPDESELGFSCQHLIAHILGIRDSHLDPDCRNFGVKRSYQLWQQIVARYGTAPNGQRAFDSIQQLFELLSGSLFFVYYVAAVPVEHLPGPRR